MTTENSQKNKSPLVLFMASFFPNRVYPVKGPFIRNFADVVSREYPLVVLTAEADEKQPGFWGVEKTQQGRFEQYTVYYNHKRVKVPVIRSIVNFLSFFRGTLKAYEMVVKDHGEVGIHHLHSSLPMGIFALYLKWLKGKSYVFSEQVTIYIYERFQQLNFLQKKLHKTIFRNAAGISGLTHYHADEIAKCGLSSEVMVIPNVIDTEYYGFKSDVKSGGPIRWIHISTLSPVKGVDDQIRSLALVVGKGHDVVFTIIGGNAERIAELKQLAQSEGVSDRIEWKGWMEREQFVPIMQQSHLFLLNSEFETFCVVAAEALACGLPVVCPAIGPFKEFIHEKNGVFFEERTPQLMAGAAIRCMQQLNQYHAQKIVAETEAKFGPEKVLQLFGQLYTKLSGQ